MKVLTARGETFSVVYSTWNRETHKCAGINRKKKCKLRIEPDASKVSHANHKIFLLDVETNQPFIIWMPLLIHFNDLKIQL